MSLSTSWRRVVASSASPGSVKVPEITLAFWVVKLLTTGTGEAASDYLAARNLVLAAGLGLLGLITGLVLQLRATRYVPWIYWLAVSMVAVFGTMAADGVHIVLGIPYPVTSTFYALVVAMTFTVWRAGEGTLDIHSIVAGRRELFYWVTVLGTFALGTALGDLSAFTLGLGLLPSALLYAALMAMPLLGWRLGLNPVLAFWWAYVLTRPLGASLADWLGKPAWATGLGLGDAAVAAAGALGIVVGVLYLTVSSRGRAPVRRARA